MNIQEMREKRLSLLQEAQKLVLGGPMDEAKRTQFDNMRSEADRLGEQITAAEKVDADIRALTQHTAPPVDDPSADGRSNKAQAAGVDYRKKFERYIRFGEKFVDERIANLPSVSEFRDLGSGVTPGPEFIPQEFYPVLTEAQKAWGGLVNIVYKKETASGAPMKVAFSNDTGNLLHESGEPATIVETDPTLSSVLLNTDMFDTGVIKVTIQELQDSAFDIDGFVRNNFGKRYFRGLTSKITNGSTSGNVAKILNATLGATTAAAGGTTIDYDDLVSLWAALDPAYLPNAKWSMNNATKAVLLKVKDTLGRPLYIPAPTAGDFDTLIGHPVVLNQYAPNVGSAVLGPIQFGDFEQGYLLRTVKPGLAIVRLNERFMDTLEVGFIGYLRAGGLITDAGTHPIQTLKMAT